MKPKKSLGLHVKRLLSGVSHHGAAHLTEVETDLVQIGLLLEVAVEKLSSNFIAIHAAVSAQQDVINVLLTGARPTPQQLAQLGSTEGEIDRNVNAAVTSMQFQDLTSQLLERNMKRVTGLCEFLSTLGTHGARMSPDSADEEIIELLADVRMALAIQSIELRGALRQAVSQQHLESGDIELF
jgi:hypothetical protein